MTTLTQTEIQNLCGELKIACAEMYKENGKTFKAKTYAKNYTILANEINQAVETNSLISNTWLRQLFTEYTRQLSTSISTPLLDAVCQYLKGINAKAYFEQMAQNVPLFFGVYNVHWKGTTEWSKNTKTVVEYQLKITHIQILGDQNLRIQLSKKSRYACLLANIGAGRRLNNTPFIVTKYNSTGSFSPECGVAILERTTLVFSDIAIGCYAQENSIFDHLRNKDLFRLITE